MYKVLTAIEEDFHVLRTSHGWMVTVGHQCLNAVLYLHSDSFTCATTQLTDTSTYNLTLLQWTYQQTINVYFWHGPLDEAFQRAQAFQQLVLRWHSSWFYTLQHKVLLSVRSINSTTHYHLTYIYIRWYIISIAIVYLKVCLKTECELVYLFKSSICNRYTCN